MAALPGGRSGRVLTLDVGTFSEDNELVDDELTVVHVVVLLATAVLAGVGELEDNTKRNSALGNTSLCDGGSTLLRAFTEPVDTLRLSSCDRSLPRTVFADSVAALEGLIIPERKISIPREYFLTVHPGNPKVLGNSTPPGVSTSCTGLSIDTERSLDGSVR